MSQLTKLGNFPIGGSYARPTERNIAVQSDQSSDQGTGDQDVRHQDIEDQNYEPPEVVSPDNALILQDLETLSKNVREETTSPISIRSIPRLTIWEKVQRDT